jgi:hypothetical protein
VLWAVAASLLAVEAGWCDEECFERAHPIVTRFGFGRIFGGPELLYGFSLSAPRSERVHRFQVGWAVPLGDTLEVTAGVGVGSDGRVELVPAMRYSPLKLGPLIVPAVALSAPLTWRTQVMEMKVRPAIELHVGLCAMVFALEIDVAGVGASRYWWAVQVGV